MDISTTWPRWLFAVTLTIAIIATAISVRYSWKVAELKRQSDNLSDLRKDYERRVKDLQARLIVQRTETINIPTPVVQEKCQTILFGQKICMPETRIEQRATQRTVSVEEPSIRRELDAALAELQRLSQATTNATVSVANFEPYYQFIEKMMRPLISFSVLLASLFVILSKRYQAEQEKWAFGSLGTVLGFWLK